MAEISRACKLREDMTSAVINLSMTVLGFAVSVIFIIFVCIRLLCARLQFRDPRTGRFRPSILHREFNGLEQEVNGMQPLEVTAFPIIKYNNEVFVSRENAICTVCLGEYEEKDILRVLPTCGHAFHINCIDVWLRQHSTCPVCRVSLRGSYGRRTVICPFLSISTQPGYIPRAISENLFEHSDAYFDSSRRNQDRDTNPGQEQSTMSFASEQNQSENDCHGTDGFNSKRENTLCYTTENNCRAQDFFHMQLNSAINDGPQFESRVLSQSMIDEMSRVDGLRPCKGLEKGSMAACNPDEIQGRQDSVSLQIDSSETNGTVSLSHGQQMMNIGSSEQIVELSSGLEKFHNGLTASGFIGTDISYGREKLDVISSAGNADRNESLGSNLILSCIEDEKSALERNVPSCERTDEDRSILAVQYVRNDESSFTASTGRNSDDTSVNSRE